MFRLREAPFAVMACATLKRSLDWESINQRPTKRRRCLPFSNPTSPSTSTSKIMEPTPSPFAEVSPFAPKLTPGTFPCFCAMSQVTNFLSLQFICRENGREHPRGDQTFEPAQAVVVRQFTCSRADARLGIEWQRDGSRKPTSSRHTTS